jgi:hypothetical protein
VATHTSQLANTPLTRVSPQPLDTFLWASTFRYLRGEPACACQWCAGQLCTLL